MAKGDYISTNAKGRPCPICGPSTYCSIRQADGFVWCFRAKDDAVVGTGGQFKRAGWADKHGEFHFTEPGEAGHILYAPAGKEAGEFVRKTAEQAKKDREEEMRLARVEIDEARKLWIAAGKEEGGGVNHLIARQYFGEFSGEAKGLGPGGGVGKWRGRGIPLQRLPGGAVPASIRYVRCAGTFEKDLGEGRTETRKLGPAILCAMRHHLEPWRSDGEGVGEGGECRGITAVQRIMLDRRAPVKRKGAASKMIKGKQVLPVGGAVDGAGGGASGGVSGGVSAGACWLGGDPKLGVLVITEGVETGLAVLAATGWLTVSVISTSGLKHWEPPEGLLVGGGGSERGSVHTVVVAGDHDGYKQLQGHRPGAAAARMWANARRAALARRGVRVVVALPDEEILAAVPEAAVLFDAAPACHMAEQDGDAAGAPLPHGGSPPLAPQPAPLDGRRGPRGGDQVAREDGKAVYELADGTRVVCESGEVPEGGLKSVDWHEVMLAAGLDGVERGLRACVEAEAGEMSAGDGGDEAGGGGGSGGGGGGGGDGGGDREGGRLDLGVHDAWEPEWYTVEGFERPVLPPQHSLRARMLLRQLFEPGAGDVAFTLRRYAGQWMVKRRGSTVWDVAPEEPLVARCGAFLDECLVKQFTRDGKPKYVEPAIGGDKVKDYLGRTAARVAVRSPTLPCWLKPDFIQGRADWRLDMDFSRRVVEGPIRADRVITFPDGLLDAEAWANREFRFLPARSDWLATSALEWSLPPEAADIAKMEDDEALELISQRCPAFTQFRQDLYEDDEETIELDRRFCGYMFLPDVSLQLALWIQGLTGTGKSTRVMAIRMVHGEDACKSGSITEIGEKFGLAPLIGCKALIFDEVRKGKSTDDQYALERMLKLIDGTPFDVEDKYLRERVRFRPTLKCIFTPNKDGGIRDEAYALVRRLRAIYVEKQVAGTAKEKIGFDRIFRQKLPWIGMDHLIGMRRVLRLMAAGAPKQEIMPQPKAHAHLLEDMRLNAAPMREFVDETLVRGQGNSCPQDVLITKVYEPWAKAKGMVENVRGAVMTERLKACIPGVRTERRSVCVNNLTGEKRVVTIYTGIRPRLPSEYVEGAELPAWALEPTDWKDEWLWPFKPTRY